MSPLAAITLKIIPCQIARRLSLRLRARPHAPRTRHPNKQPIPADPASIKLKGRGKMDRQQEKKALRKITRARVAMEIQQPAGKGPWKSRSHGEQPHVAHLMSAMAGKASQAAKAKHRPTGQESTH